MDLRKFFYSSSTSTKKTPSVASNKRNTYSKEDDDLFYKETKETKKRAVENIYVEPTYTIDGQTINLSEGQRRAIKAALSGRNIFFTGSAGVGKSLTLKILIDKMREIHGKAAVFVTASTGVAACNLDGTTLHSFAGAGLGKDKFEVVAKRLSSRQDALERWRGAKVLIIDEISMITNQYFELLDKIGRHFRAKQGHNNRNRFFGGIQLILCGDFCQLGSINDEEDMKKAINNVQNDEVEEDDAEDATDKQIYLFESPLWQKMFPVLSSSYDIFNDNEGSDEGVMIHLTEVFRQKDKKFVDLLQACRLGRQTQEHIDMLWQRVIKQKPPSQTIQVDEIRPTRLYPHKKDVAFENLQELKRLSGESFMFVAVDKGIPKCIELLEKHCAAEAKIVLKKGAQVVLLRNLDFGRGLVNGSRGIVTDFLVGNDQTMPFIPLVKFDNGEMWKAVKQEWKLEQGKEVLASRTQIPLALCWATTIHKSMGQTLSKVETRLASVFACGQAYTSLSRCTSLEGLSLIDFDPRKIFANPKVVAFYDAIDAMCSKEKQEHEERDLDNIKQND